MRSFPSLLPFLLLPAPLWAQIDHARNDVDPFIGTGGHGHTFPGACVPNGLVQLSPDTRTSPTEWDGCSGYHYSDSVIYGFSHTHLSGTGCADLCDVLLMPMSGRRSLDPEGYASRFSHAREEAHAGYYRVHLDGPNVEAELTATAHSGVHRYGFPKGDSAFIALDLTHRDKLIESSIEQVSPTEFAGERRSGSWAQDQHLFFYIRLSSAVQGAMIQHQLTADATDHVAMNPKALLVLGKLDAPLVVKVGISAVSIEGARANLDAEVPGWDFDAVRKQAEDAWNAKLGKIEVQGGTREQQRVFYTALYHCYVTPYVFSDVDGHYRGMDGQVHHADHKVYTVFSLWDTFRTLHPLMTLLEPDMTNDFIKTFLLHYEQGGRLPVWELWGNETDCMIGYHSVSVIADAYLKGIRGFDANEALQAMVASAMRDDPGLNAYRSKGYISSEDAPESVSKTLEYAYDDWCIAQMASAMGRDSIASLFYDRSRNWQNVFDPITGFFRPRYNGGFKEPFDPYEVNFNFTEANAWQYGLFVPHDLPAFTQDLGGKEALEKRLDALFGASTETTGRDQSDISGLIGQYAHGNEPSHHMAYLYNFTGHPEKSAALVKRIMTDLYHDAPDGLAGNEDCGQMSAWYVMSALGLYPVAPGCDRYWVGPQAFDSITWKLPHAEEPLKGPFDLLGPSNEPDPWPSVTQAQLLGRFPWLLTPGMPVPDHAHPLTGWLPQHARTVVPAPIFNPSATTFRDSLLVKVTAVPGPWHAVLRANTAQDTKTNGQLELHASDTVVAHLVDERGRSGPGITARFTRMEGNTTIALESPYAPQYAAGGGQALVDGVRGGGDFRTGEWQGFHDTDVVATIDLGSVKKLQRAGISVFQDEGAWIWYPSSVTFAWSMDGHHWSSSTVENTVPRDGSGGMRQELWTKSIGKRARYVKVMAHNAGPCPDWHVGHGGASWIFTDEVLIDAK